MTGETNLQILLKNMQAELRPGEYVFSTINPKNAGDLRLKAVCTFDEPEGLTLILPRLEAEKAAITYQYPARMITLHIHSSLEAVGFLAAITKKLAENGVSVNAVSAYYHDHLFVPVEKAELVMGLLKSF
jgi:hypothetical protein